MFANRNKGFTLIELLVVIAIIGILSSVVLASLNSARTKSRDARRIGDMKQVQLALEMYYDTEGHYPAATSSLVSSYLPTFPRDPGSNAYTYVASTSPATTYVLRAELENHSHSALNSDVDDASGSMGSSYGAAYCADSSGYYCIQP